MLISRNSKNLNIALGLIVVILGLSSCYENVEGCLDPDSANYTVTADINCEDCCTYPTLSLLVSYFLGDVSYNRQDTFINDLGVEFVIEDAQIYFSEIVLSDGSNDYQIEDTFEYTDQSGNDQAAIDDIILAQPTKYRYTLGTFTYSNEYTSLSVGLGIPEEIDQAQSITVTSDHPLVAAGDSLYIADQNQYVNSWILIRQIDVHDMIADTLQIPGIDYTFVFDNLQISQARGSSVDAKIKVDYQLLVQGIDYTTMNKSDVVNKIGDNLKLAISADY